MKTTIILITISVLLFFGLNFGANSNGGYAGAFMRLGLGARHLALGNSSVAAPVDAYSFYYNPALSALQQKRMFTLSHRFMALDRKFDFIGFATPIPPGAGFSVGWIHSGVGDIQGYNMIGEQTGSIDHNLNAIYFNFSRLFNKKLAVGLTIKHIREDLDFGSDSYNASGWGWDFGLAYVLNEKLTLAASLRDVGSKLTANTEKLFEFGGTTVFNFPKIWSVGATYQTPLPWLRMNYAFSGTSYEKSQHLGLEATYHKILALRLGYNKDQFTFGAGMGFKIWKYFTTLDYALVPSVVDEGASHVFSWQFYLN
ncbi:MAG: PorV/PorQ family protein [Caldisericaceae bacterium]|nr:PorV/PorQ family protein [Caldisericaceae bacterium]